MSTDPLAAGPSPDPESDPVEELAQAFLSRLRNGERPSIEDYARRHPELAEQIREVFPAMLALERLKPPRSSPAARPAPSAPPRERLGNYRLLREVGRGGMGIVYEAEHTSLRRRVALKVLPDVAALQPERLARFQREARAASRLHHTNVVPVFEVGQDGGLWFYAMQFIPGRSLDHVLRDLRRPAGAAETQDVTWPSTAPPTPRSGVTAVPQPADLPDPNSQAYFARVAELMRQAAAAVAYAHSQGVLHRDLKPANLLLEGSDRLWVADFGLARIADEEMTRTGSVLGTLRYVAPEQLDGRATPLSDVYALGLTLYEMLTLRPAFDAGDQVALIDQIRRGLFPAPRAVRRAIPRDLETITLRALEPDPARRYQGAAALADDLQRFLEDRPVNARRAGPLERLARWGRRQPALASMLAVLAAVIVTSFVAVSLALNSALTGWGQAREHADRADREADEARKARTAAEGNLYGSRLARALLEWRVNRMGHARHELELCPPESRGWEWRHLRHLLHSDLRTIEAGQPMVYKVAFSPDGERLVAGMGDPFSKEPDAVKQTVAVWDLRGERPAFILSPTRTAHAVALSPDGALLATNASRPGGPIDRFGSGMIRLYDARTGREVRTLRGPFDRLFDLDFSPDGLRLAVAIAGDEPGKACARVIDVRTGKDVLPPLRRNDQVRLVAFSPDGKLLASGGLSDHVLVHDLGSGKQVAKLASPDEASGLAFGPRGRLAVASGCRVGLWEFVRAAGQGAREVKVESVLQFTSPVRVLRVAVSPDGRFIAGGCADSSVRLWDTDLGREALVLRGHSGRVASVSFHPSGRLLVSGGQQPGEIKMWDLTRQPEHHSLPQDGPIEDLEALCFSADGLAVRTVSYRGRLLTREVDSDRTVAACRVDLEDHWLVPSRKAVFSATGALLATRGGREPGSLLIHNAASGRRTHVLRGHPADVSLAAFSGDERRVAASGLVGKEASRAVTVWDLSAEGGLELLSLRFATRQRIAGALALDRDGGLLAFDRYPDGDGPECEIRVVSVPSGETVADLPAAARCSCLAFSPDNKKLAAVALSGQLRLWDVRTWRPLYERPAQGPEGVTELAWSPDGRRLAGVNRDLVQVWDVESGRGVLELKGAADRVWDPAFNPQVAWSPDGRRLAITNHDNSVSIWDSEAGAAQGKARLWRAWEARAYPWLLRQARQQLAHGSAFAVEFYHGQLARMGPPTPRSRSEWADLLARMGRWKEAAAEHERALAADPALACPEALRRSVLLWHACGEAAKARAAGRRLLAQWQASREPSATDALCRACVRDGSLLSDAGPLLRHLEAEAERRPRDHWQPFCLGVIRHRGGEHRKAVEALSRSRERGEEYEWKAAVWLLLALAHERLGERQEALRWWKEAASWYEQTRGDRAKWQAVVRLGGWELAADLEHLLEEARAALRPE
jgi:WD40 repeat protein/serine/threonine protein kinase